MTLEQLKAFCATDNDRRTLLYPWTEGDWSFASDGRRIIITPKIDGAIPPDETDTPKGIRFLNEIRQCEKSQVWREYDGVEGSPIGCKFCYIECEWCHGDGFVSRDKECPLCGCVSENQDACNKCDGDGFLLADTCDVCSGTRIISTLRFGEATLDPFLVRTLPGFPNIEYLWQTDPVKAVMFRFDGGYAQGMPLKPGSF